VVRRVAGVFEFTQAQGCILRLQRARAPHDLRLADGTTVRKGEPVLLLHLWNERLPSMGPEGPDLAWAVEMRRRLITSLREVARWLRDGQCGEDIRAIGGVTVLLDPADEGGGQRLMRRLGFAVLPYPGPLGRFGGVWEDLYTWWLMWAFNAATLRHRRLLRLRRTEVWISTQALLERYG